MERKEIKKFGITLGILLMIIGGVLFVKGHLSTSKWFFGCGATVIGISLCLPVLLLPVYRFMIWLSHYMGIVMTTIILSLVFYLVFTPAGLLIRLLRKDILDRGINKDASSYWLKRIGCEFDQTSYEKQF